MESARVRTSRGVCLGLDVQHAGLEDRMLLSGGLAPDAGPIAHVVSMPPAQVAAAGDIVFNAVGDVPRLASWWRGRFNVPSAKIGSAVNLPALNLDTAGWIDAGNSTMIAVDGVPGASAQFGPRLELGRGPLSGGTFAIASFGSAKLSPFMKIEDFFLRYRGPGGDLPGRVPLLIAPGHVSEGEDRGTATSSADPDTPEAAAGGEVCQISLLQRVPTVEPMATIRILGAPFTPDATDGGAVDRARIEILVAEEELPLEGEESPQIEAQAEGDISVTEGDIDPIGSGLRTAALAFDPASWDEAVTLLMDGMDDLLTEIGEIGNDTAYLPWVVGAGLAITATEVARKVRTRPRFALSTSGSSCVEPSRGGRC